MPISIPICDDGGAITDTYAYDAFGNTIAHTGSTVNEFQYRGEQYDSSLEMYDLRARWYRTSTGRFLTADTFEGVVGYGKSHHRYAYGENEPIQNLDPSGHGMIATARRQHPLVAVFVGHRLCASGHVDNAEAEMAESGEVVPINTLTVGTAMPDRFHSMIRHTTFSGMDEQ